MAIIDEDNRIARLQAAAEAIDADGGMNGAADAALILFMLRAIRTSRQRINDLEGVRDTLAQRVATLETREANDRAALIALNARVKALETQTLTPAKVPSSAAVRGANLTQGSA